MSTFRCFNVLHNSTHHIFVSGLFQNMATSTSNHPPRLSETTFIRNDIHTRIHTRTYQLRLSETGRRERASDAQQLRVDLRVARRNDGPRLPTADERRVVVIVHQNGDGARGTRGRGREDGCTGEWFMCMCNSCVCVCMRLCTANHTTNYKDAYTNTHIHTTLLL
jgi:hypothetical protein